MWNRSTRKHTDKGRGARRGGATRAGKRAYASFLCHATRLFYKSRAATAAATTTRPEATAEVEAALRSDEAVDDTVMIADDDDTVVTGAIQKRVGVAEAWVQWSALVAATVASLATFTWY